MPSPFQPTPGALERALVKVASREEAFIADCAGGRRRTLIRDTFGLSMEQVDLLQAHYAERIRAFRFPMPTGPVGIERSLPPGDRE